MSHHNVCIIYDNVSCTCEGRTHTEYSHQGFMKNEVRTQNNNFWRSMFKKASKSEDYWCNSQRLQWKSGVIFDTLM